MDTMGFTVKHKKKNNKIIRSFTYTGDLEECIKAAQKELANKSDAQERIFLKWQADRAKKALEKYENRITDLQIFIQTAKQKIEEEQREEENKNAEAGK